ncbi:neoverrucotoxin subunit beta-like [Dendropsophus ebraccatus]|uniref:neoverrucotoxin subunit beta-like n=1 Tax=Dendropsophus ebraccatus TaxID=150705 RepID=UPI003831987D
MALEIPALGRPFTLGMLYDCREEKIIPGITLWNREDLARNIIEKSQKGTDFDVLTSDSLSDKSSALNISGALKISLWSGMIDIEGSGKYLTDTKESEKQARVTLQYKRTTKFEQLAMNHLSYNNITYQEVFDKAIATHVVTGILYGAQAFYIFDQKVNNSEKVKDVQGKLQVMVTKIGDLTVNMGMNSTEREEVLQFGCKFHGDFALEKNPVTYEEAVEIYASLPSLLGENGEKAVPMKVWLYPLKNLDSRAARLVRDISDHLVFRAEDIMQQMSEVVMECNDMMGHPAATTFPALANKIVRFRKLFERFRVMYKKQLAQVLPSVRGGNMEESSLEDILLRVQTHLTYLLRESVLKISRQNAANLCFNFNLDYEDLYLSHLESWFHREPWDFQDTFSNGETKNWYEQYKISEHVFLEVQKFLTTKCFEADFVITAFACRSGPGIKRHLLANEDVLADFCLCQP